MPAEALSLLSSRLKERLRQHFGDRMREQVPLAPYTSARIGGPAEVLVEVTTLEDWEHLLPWLWEEGVPFWILGGGSNVLVADQGVPGVVIWNRTRGWRWLHQDEEALLWSMSGSGFTPMARYTVDQGYQGLEWAVGIPGTVGGAVVGNAGAFGGDVAAALAYALLWHRDLGQVQWNAQELALEYRGSRLKQGEPAVVLAAVFRLQADPQGQARKRMTRWQEHRRRTQPPGASMGSMFKNPPGDYAGRLIDAVGLKGTRIGDAQISPLHANFFLNHGRATAHQVWQLMRLAQERVAQTFGIWLEPEVQLVGAWPEEMRQALHPPVSGGPSHGR